ncbi:MAG: hypothetical protein KIT84_26710 [Labilithrix sp.]|nr:hypothetical protein [Labilithrix sp.]MCW5814646.1 hypothetical protein [Labilithrix sp.]
MIVRTTVVLAFVAIAGCILPDTDMVTPEGNACGAYAFTIACDQVLSGGARQCTEYYGNFPAGYPARQSDENLCTAGKGTILPGKCPTEQTLGSCTTTSAMGSYGKSAIQFQYEAPSVTAEGLQRSCGRTRGTYAAPGTPPAPPGAGASQSCGGSKASSGAVSFSLSVGLNGAPIACADYFGATPDQVAAALRSGATTEPCPRENIVAICDLPRGSFDGLRAIEVSYRAFDDEPRISKEECEGMGGTFSTTYP